VVSFTPRPLYPRKIAPVTHWVGGWVGPRAVLDAVVKDERLLPLKKDWSIALVPQKTSGTVRDACSYLE
jgi:hypothetical protein